ncbi:uncharacterized protein LDX57_008193 [Aspergillus melleus]|uniref:uncharacterized protein n=1 Tax=Aspergillus melleus TaxID=138277 RepID=UPI001E8DA736|nr:uncharacterized protein LDX57_008193 [Aspergillus melleus]KAH8430531.1 hypothetical protein LDX57_008193 [Aspergillus melleus]
MFTPSRPSIASTLFCGSPLGFASPATLRRVNRRASRTTTRIRIRIVTRRADAITGSTAAPANAKSAPPRLSWESLSCKSKIVSPPSVSPTNLESLLFVVTAFMSFRNVMHFRRTGTLPDAVSDPTFAAQSKAAFSSNPHEFDEEEDDFRSRAGMGSSVRGDRDEDYALLQQNEADELGNPNGRSAMHGSYDPTASNTGSMPQSDNPYTSSMPQSDNPYTSYGGAYGQHYGQPSEFGSNISSNYGQPSELGSHVSGTYGR